MGPYFVIKKNVPSISICSSPCILPNLGFCPLPVVTAAVTDLTIVSIGLHAFLLFIRVLANVAVNLELSTASSYPAEVNTCADLAPATLALSHVGASFAEREAE